MERLRWFQNALGYERKLLNQSRSEVADLQQKLAESQGLADQLTAYLHCERERGDTYQRLANDRQAIEERLQIETRRRESYQQRCKELAGAKRER
jgi:thymidine kinase